METLHLWGLEFIRAIQGKGPPALSVIMRGITLLGNMPAYLLLLSLVYWCVDEKKGFRLALALLISAWVNISLKFLLDQPRPFFAAYDPSVAMIPERLGGLPSGHAQNTLVMWIIIASWTRKKRFYAAALAACLLVSFSRIYLGVHFPTDILGGWILGALVLCGYFLCHERLAGILERGGFRAGMLSAAAAAFIMILYRPADEAIVPGALFLGMGTGYCLNKRYIGFHSSALWRKTGAAGIIRPAACFILGFAALALILAAFGKLIPRDRYAPHYALLYFIRFAAAGLWVSCGAPWLYRFLPLAGKGESGDRLLR